MTRPRPSSRRRAREAAVQILYALDLARGRGAETSVEEAFEAVAESFELPEGARAFAKELVHGVEADRTRIDDLLTEASSHWRLPRMAAVDRNVLRLSTFELLRAETPPEVVIDQAVELARRFGNEPSPAFVNGVLDAVARRLAGEARAPA